MRFTLTITPHLFPTCEKKNVSARVFENPRNTSTSVWGKNVYKRVLSLCKQRKPFDLRVGEECVNVNYTRVNNVTLSTSVWGKNE